jgi:dihydropteroate synthase
MQMIQRKKFTLKLRTRMLALGEHTLIMGVLNVTPDSFSDGGRFFSVEDAVKHALAMQRAGADLIDVGGESTRPGSEGVAAAEELRRLLPVLQALRGKLKIPISIDTRKASVAEIALGAGAEIINDVSGLKHDPKVAGVAARHQAPLILMHMRGEPRTMQKSGFARDVMKDVIAGLHASIAKARKAGVRDAQIVVDPGIGFGKSFEQNYEVLRRLPELARLGYPLMVGTSRKGFLGVTLASGRKRSGTDERMWTTAATVAASILGGAHIVRVHDVSEMAQVSRAADCVLNPEALAGE